MALIQLDISAELTERNNTNIGTIVDELNYQSGLLTDFKTAASVVKKGFITATNADFTESNTLNPRNPHFDWTATKTVAHGLGYVPIVNAYYGNSRWDFYDPSLYLFWRLPFLDMYPNSDPPYYINKPALRYDVSVDANNIYFNLAFNFFNLDPGITLYFYYVLLDQAVDR